jgi:4'-phosphopantetheinyl transferase
MALLWPAGSLPVTWEPGDVHVWSANLEPAADQLARLQGLLAPDEAARAARFRFWRDQRRYIAGRGILRILLGQYMGKAPEAIEIAYSEYGKPFLEGQPLQFNLAHSEALAVFAFCQTADVGVDVERIRHVSDAEGIAARFFAPSENEIFQATDVDRRDEAFFACWTRKEAFIKAVGEGLSYPLDSFEVAFSVGEEPRLVSVDGNKEQAARWSLFALSPAPGYGGALAIGGRDWRLLCWRFGD